MWHEVAEAERLVRTGWSMAEVNGWFRDEYDHSCGGGGEEGGEEEEVLSESEISEVTIASDSLHRAL